MDDPREALQIALKQAMREQDSKRRGMIRLMQSAIKQIEIDTRKPLSAEDVVGVLQKEAKMLRESIAELDQTGHTERAAEARAELAIVESFLPQQLGRAEIEAVVRDAIAQTGATSSRDMGRVMGVVMPQLKGRADGSLINQVVRDLLNS